MTERSSPLAVRFLGLGLMGQGMATQILKGGHHLTVMANSIRQPVEDLVRRGAVEGPTPKSVAEASEAVVLCLPNTEVVVDVLSGDQGLLAATKPDILLPQ